MRVGIATDHGGFGLNDAPAEIAAVNQKISV